MFFNGFNRALLCAGIFALSACGGGDPADAPMPPVRQSPATVVQQANPGSATQSAPPAAQGSATRNGFVATAAERDAEQLRMVPYEQSFSIEIRRRALERPEHLREPAEPPRAAGQAACDTSAQAKPADCPASPPVTPVQAAAQAL